MAGTRFELRYGTLRWLLVAMGLGPRHSFVEVGDAEVRVQMGWAFRARIPRDAIRCCDRDQDMRWGIGVHGWRGRWLVNGATTGIVTIDIDPPAQAHVIGCPSRLRRLHVSVAEPDALVAALAP